MVRRCVRWPYGGMAGLGPDARRFRSGSALTRPAFADGPANPLGARALYLYEGNKDTLYRIHGTNQPEYASARPYRPAASA